MKRSLLVLRYHIFLQLDINEIREDLYDYGRDFGYLFDLETYLPPIDGENDRKLVVPFANTLRQLIDSQLLPESFPND